MTRPLRQKLAAGLLAALACAALYIVPSRLTAGHARLLELSALDMLIPYLPWTVWFYLAQYPLLLIAYFGCTDSMRCHRFLRVVVVVQAAAAAAFVAVPIRYPRELFVAPEATGQLTVIVCDWGRSIDPPVNCLPSLHVTSCVLVLCLIGRASSPARLAGWMVALASIVSTLTFKQHYVVDLLAGSALASIVCWADMAAQRLRAQAQLPSPTDHRVKA